MKFWAEQTCETLPVSSAGRLGLSTLAGACRLEYTGVSRGVRMPWNEEVTEMAGKNVNQPLFYLAVTVLVAVVAIVVYRASSERRGASLRSTAGDGEPDAARAFFAAAFEETMMRSPMFQTELGIKTDYDKWDDLSADHADETIAILNRQLKTLEETVAYNDLDPETRLSYDLFTDDARRAIARDRYRYHDYPVNQMYGWHERVASFLINYHQVTSVADAEAYIARLGNVPALFDQVIEGLEVRRRLGVVPPKFVFPRALPVCRNIITGAPFDDSGENSTIFADFTSKVDALDIDDGEKSRLITRAKETLNYAVRPAYDKLIAYLTELETSATTDDGVWKLPDGEAYYSQQLLDITTTELTAAEIHDHGITEVDRIHGEMRAIMDRVGFRGSLQEFFDFMREDDQFYYEDTEAGKQAYLQRATEIIDTMRGRLDELFLTKPKAALVVKAVEPFREKSAGGAFYQRPSPDGSRPGVYYANLSRMENMPKYEMESLAYHEAIPGHHMQLAIAIELTDIPTFRKYLDYTAHVEGWGLYAELVPKEIGLYADPYSDFGRLSGELWRACRLVVDTGIHSKRWTRDRAIDYLVENTPGSRDESTRAIERYIVMPGQATAYKIGMLKILELRARAQEALGERFDIREYHDLILANGPVPLGVLERLVADWIAAKNAQS